MHSPFTEFTPDQACKDSHILINGMTCSQLMNSVFGHPGCTSDVKVQNMCCRSCQGKSTYVDNDNDDSDDSDDDSDNNSDNSDDYNHNNDIYK